MCRIESALKNIGQRNSPKVQLPCYITSSFQVHSKRPDQGTCNMLNLKYNCNKDCNLKYNCNFYNIIVIFTI